MVCEFIHGEQQRYKSVCYVTKQILNQKLVGSPEIVSMFYVKACCKHHSLPLLPSINHAGMQKTKNHLYAENQ